MQNDDNILNGLEFNTEDDKDRILKANLEVALKHIEALSLSEFNKEKDELYYYKVFANTLSKCGEKEVRLVFSKLNEIFYNFKLNELSLPDQLLSFRRRCVRVCKKDIRL